MACIVNPGWRKAMPLGELETKIIQARATQTFQLTPRQIVAIYDAGRERGSDEATSWEWGSRPDRHRLAELETALVWSDECGLVTGMDFDQKQVWWSAFKAAIAE